MNSEFPDIAKWFAVIAMREHGLALVILLVVSAAGLLVNARYLYPRLLPFIRRAVVALFFASFVVLMVSRL